MVCSRPRYEYVRGPEGPGVMGLFYPRRWGKAQGLGAPVLGKGWEFAGHKDEGRASVI